MLRCPHKDYPTGEKLLCKESLIHTEGCAFIKGEWYYFQDYDDYDDSICVYDNNACWMWFLFSPENSIALKWHKLETLHKVSDYFYGKSELRLIKLKSLNVENW